MEDSATIKCIDERYVMKETLGQGGMSIVYKVLDRDSGSDFALKTVRPDRANDQVVLDVLEHEAHLGIEVFSEENLGGQGFPRVRQVGHWQPTGSGLRSPYLVMDLVDGVPLHDWLDRKASVLKEPAARDLIYKIGTLVDSLHGEGVTHRDLKPGNIIIQADDQVLITDFGLASWQGSISSPTSGTKQFVSPSWAAPEQLAGNDEGDPRVDIYSLGSLLCYLVTKKPFHKVNEEDLTEAASPSLVQVIRKACAAAPESRYSNVQGFLDACNSKKPSQRPSLLFAGAIPLLLLWLLISQFSFEKKEYAIQASLTPEEEHVSLRLHFEGHAMDLIYYLPQEGSSNNFILVNPEWERDFFESAIGLSLKSPEGLQALQEIQTQLGLSKLDADGRLLSSRKSFTRAVRSTIDSGQLLVFTLSNGDKIIVEPKPSLD